MKDGEKRKTRHKTPASSFIEVPVLLETVSCPACDSKVELWAGDHEAVCGHCGHRIVRRGRKAH